MEKSVKIILFVILGIVLINFIVMLFGNSSMKDIRNDLQQAKRGTDSALNELQYSQSKLDSIKSDMINLQSHLTQIQAQVAVNDAAKRVEEARNESRAAELKNKIKQSKPRLSTDSLPGIDVIVLKNR
ncbi:hypothetical protein FC093_11315 [Ilyomonas limi]|uniref:Uncharacterized protein n=1 Tax=Ilyomonas limi TaxID=2575867 RepID=A0A4U3KZW9_9BACT|nr:hypothetical protein [Ilyomonas limi]TKK68218.1 hypothetical protein FC093_11315 [Ilyomonas limi]